MNKETEALDRLYDWALERLSPMDKARINAINYDIDIIRAALSRHDARVQELLESNNQLLERARKAEYELEKQKPHTVDVESLKQGEGHGRQIEAKCDDNPKVKFRALQDDQGDVWLSIINEKGLNSVRLRTKQGGGSNLELRRALAQLIGNLEAKDTN